MAVKLKTPRKSLQNARKALRELQAALLDHYGANAPRVLIYGSYARHEANLDSDIDILLVYPNDIRAGQEIYALSPTLSDLNLRYQVLISLLPTYEAEYERSGDPFWRNIKQEGISIESI